MLWHYIGRNPGTITTYSGAQKELMKWMAENGSRFPGQNKLLMTEQKLLLFLNEALVGRPRRKRGRKRQTNGRITEESEFESTEKVGIQTY
jgi:hypothetical protein